MDQPHIHPLHANIQPLTVNAKHPMDINTWKWAADHRWGKLIFFDTVNKVFKGEVDDVKNTLLRVHPHNAETPLFLCWFISVNAELTFTVLFFSSLLDSLTLISIPSPLSSSSTLLLPSLSLLFSPLALNDRKHLNLTVFRNWCFFCC